MDSASLEERVANLEKLLDALVSPESADNSVARLDDSDASKVYNYIQKRTTELESEIVGHRLILGDLQKELRRKVIIPSALPDTHFDKPTSFIISESVSPQKVTKVFEYTVPENGIYAILVDAKVTSGRKVQFQQTNLNIAQTDYDFNIEAHNSPAEFYKTSPQVNNALTMNNTLILNADDTVTLTLFYDGLEPVKHNIRIIITKICK